MFIPNYNHVHLIIIFIFWRLQKNRLDYNNRFNRIIADSKCVNPSCSMQAHFNRPGTGPRYENT